LRHVGIDDAEFAPPGTAGKHVHFYTALDNQMGPNGSAIAGGTAKRSKTSRLFSGKRRDGIIRARNEIPDSAAGSTTKHCQAKPAESDLSAAECRIIQYK
jgi:hypothetical protein